MSIVAPLIKLILKIIVRSSGFSFELNVCTFLGQDLKPPNPTFPSPLSRVLRLRRAAGLRARNRPPPAPHRRLRLQQGYAAARKQTRSVSKRGRAEGVGAASKLRPVLRRGRAGEPLLRCRQDSASAAPHATHTNRIGSNERAHTHAHSNESVPMSRISALERSRARAAAGRLGPHGSAAVGGVPPRCVGPLVRPCPLGGPVRPHPPPPNVL